MIHQPRVPLKRTVCVEITVALLSPFVDVGRDLGVRESMRWLHERGYVIAVLSNNCVGRLKKEDAIQRSVASF